MTNSEARKRAQEALLAAEVAGTIDAGVEVAGSATPTPVGPQIDAQAIRARDVEMLLADARAHSMPGRTHPWCPSCVDGIEALAAALTAARAEVAENERLMIGMRNARDRAEAVVESVRELADAYQRDVDNEQIDGDGAIVLGAVADDLKRLTTPTTTETGGES